MLSLDDKRWSSLQTRNEDGGWVPRWLRRLQENPNDLNLFWESRSLSNYAEENTYSAAFAATPYLVEVARSAQPAERLHYVFFVAMVTMYRIPPGGSDPYMECPPDLEEGFQEAIASALEMAVALLPVTTREPNVRWLLASIAALRGFPGFGRAVIEIQHEQRQDPPQEEIPF
jgi:hypothetical protein